MYACASIDYTYFNNAKNLFSRNEIIVSDSFVDNFKYSFIKASYQKNDAIFVLSRVLKDGSYEWIGSNYEMIRTKDGIIIETIGLDSDIRFHNSQLPDFKNFTSSHHYIDLYDPDLIYEKLVLNYKDTEFVENNSLFDKVITIQRTNDTIGWNSQDMYFYKEGILVKSIQKINPLQSAIEIDFYLKY